MNTISPTTSNEQRSATKLPSAEPGSIQEPNAHFDDGIGNTSELDAKAEEFETMLKSAASDAPAA